MLFKGHIITLNSQSSTLNFFIKKFSLTFEKKALKSFGGFRKNTTFATAFENETFQSKT